MRSILFLTILLSGCASWSIPEPFITQLNSESVHVQVEYDLFINAEDSQVASFPLAQEQCRAMDKNAVMISAIDRPEPTYNNEISFNGTYEFIFRCD